LRRSKVDRHAFEAQIDLELLPAQLPVGSSTRPRAQGDGRGRRVAWSLSLCAWHGAVAPDAIHSRTAYVCV